MLCYARIVGINLETGANSYSCTRVGLHYYLSRLSCGYPQGVVAINRCGAAESIESDNLAHRCVFPTELCSQFVIRSDNKILQHSPDSVESGHIAS